MRAGKTMESRHCIREERVQFCGLLADVISLFGREASRLDEVGKQITCA
jgi:hypothetical protein